MLVSYEYSHALNGFKQVQIAYLAAISYLDKLVQPSYTNQAQGYAQDLLSNAWHFDLRVVMLVMQQLSRLIKGDVYYCRAERVKCFHI